MMVIQGLTLVAAVAAGASMELGGHQAQLVVSATVVRPAEIIVFPSRVEDAVALIRNAEAIEVVAESGTVRQLDEGTAAVTSDSASQVIVTLIF